MANTNSYKYIVTYNKEGSNMKFSGVLKMSSLEIICWKIYKKAKQPSIRIVLGCI